MRTRGHPVPLLPADDNTEQESKVTVKSVTSNNNIAAHNAVPRESSTNIPMAARQPAGHCAALQSGFIATTQHTAPSEAPKLSSSINQENSTDDTAPGSAIARRMRVLRDKIKAFNMEKEIDRLIVASLTEELEILENMLLQQRKRQEARDAKKFATKETVSQPSRGKLGLQIVGKTKDADNQEFPARESKKLSSSQVAGRRISPPCPPEVEDPPALKTSSVELVDADHSVMKERGHPLSAKVPNKELQACYSNGIAKQSSKQPLGINSKKAVKAKAVTIETTKADTDQSEAIKTITSTLSDKKPPRIIKEPSELLQSILLTTPGSSPSKTQTSAPPSKTIATDAPSRLDAFNIPSAANIQRSDSRINPHRSR